MDIQARAADVVTKLLSSFSKSIAAKQALVLAYYNITLSGYPTLQEAGLVNSSGQFIVAGGRIIQLQRQGVRQIKELSISLAPNDLVDLCRMQRENSHCSLLVRISENTGSFINFNL